jgi:gluconate 2-dehydrogenase gamma chain
MNTPEFAASDESPEMMRRRALLKRAVWLLGGAVSAPAALALLQGCSPKERTAKLEVLQVAQFMTEGNTFEVVSDIAEIMIPKTETSGARDAGVPMFIDGALAALYPRDAQDRFSAGCAEFQAAAKSSGKAFLERDPGDRAAFVKQTLETALAGDRDPKPFILMVRELTLLGYFSSQVGITENMDYVPVPTVYHGCVPLTQMNKHVYWE